MYALKKEYVEDYKQNNITGKQYKQTKPICNNVLCVCVVCISMKFSADSIGSSYDNQRLSQFVTENAELNLDLRVCS